MRHLLRLPVDTTGENARPGRALRVSCPRAHRPSCRRSGSFATLPALTPRLGQPGGTVLLSAARQRVRDEPGLRLLCADAQVRVLHGQVLHVGVAVVTCDLYSLAVVAVPGHLRDQNRATAIDQAAAHAARRGLPVDGILRLDGRQPPPSASLTAAAARHGLALAATHATSCRPRLGAVSRAVIGDLVADLRTALRTMTQDQARFRLATEARLSQAAWNNAFLSLPQVAALHRPPVANRHRGLSVRTVQPGPERGRR